MDDIDKDGLVHTYDWRLHTSFANTVNTSASPWTIADGSVTLDMHALHPTADSVSVTTQSFDNFNGDPNSILLTVTRTAIDPRFSFLLIPRDANTPPPAVIRQSYPWGYACSIAWGGGVVDQMIRNDSGAPATHGDITTDALVTWVREVDGAVDGYLAAGVTQLVIASTEYATIDDGPATCEMSGSTIHVDRADADFRFFDTGIATVICREQALGFTVEDGYVVATSATDVDRAPPRKALALAAYPNPFNPNTTIRIDGVRGERVRVVVYDVAGRLVRRLWDAPLRTASAALVWDGRDDRGHPAASGTYFLRASTASASRTLKLTLVK
jgi:hypothetical protein